MKTNYKMTASQYKTFQTTLNKFTKVEKPLSKHVGGHSVEVHGDYSVVRHIISKEVNRPKKKCVFVLHCAGIQVIIEAYTRSEARAELKKMYSLKRVPNDVLIEKDS